ncbi:peroxisomal biogenesis factor 11 [Catenaria anguillulae PL171]|uniref:Peroxisomal biogenesis factor 11 n=1 Tax=Catenaria anguillulae PL171 TaxID=765915 RepID=A0A1Y2HX28_9FUNG|nr:peroxisomal biogenesis factor 11 [Catenaria anguillulae PL171]
MLTKYTATTVGRDKLYRLIQYLSKFLAHRLLTLDAKANKDTIDKLTKLVKHLSLSRKLMRIGRPLEYAQNLLTNVPATKDPVIRYCLIGKNMLLTVWMGYDFLAWAQGVGLWKSTDAKRMQERTNRFWFAGLACGLVSTVYQIHVNMSKYVRFACVRLLSLSRFRSMLSTHLLTYPRSVYSTRSKLLRQIFQELLDILVPAKGLGYHSLSDGVIGLTGALTSAMGAQAQWNKVHGGK